MVRVVTLTTDFGHGDSFVGQMKGVLVGIAPRAVVIDLCHAVPPGEVAVGAYVLETGYAAFPPGTIHVAVVDPGVGGSRRAILVEAGGQVFVAPDNGLLSRVLDSHPGSVVYDLDVRRVARGPVSPTFHGRDVFAPAAGRVAAGAAPDDLGSRGAPPIRLRPAGTALEAGRARPVPVVHVDRFGNVVLDVREADLAVALGRAPRPGDPMRLEAPGGSSERFVETFASAADDSPVLLLNSARYLECAVRAGNAAERLGLVAGYAAAVLTVGRPGPQPLSASRGPRRASGG